MHVLRWAPTVVNTAHAVKGAPWWYSHVASALGAAITRSRLQHFTWRAISKCSTMQHHQRPACLCLANINSNEPFKSHTGYSSSSKFHELQQGRRRRLHVRFSNAQPCMSSTYSFSGRSSSRIGSYRSLLTKHISQLSFNSCGHQAAVTARHSCCGSRSVAVMAAATRSRSGSSSSNGGGGSTRTGKIDWRITDTEEALLWRGAVEALQRPAAIVGAQILDLDWRLGVNPDILPSKDVKKPPGWQRIQDSKMDHPTAIALIHNKRSYMAAGLDAVLLVEYCGSSYVGGAPRHVLQASFPEESIHACLKQLVEEAGLSVAVWEPVVPAGASNSTESAAQAGPYLHQVVTPESSLYTYRYAESSTDRDVVVPTLFGVSTSISGLSVYRLNRSTMTIETFNGLSDDGFWGILRSERSANPVVYVFRPLDASKPTSAAYASDTERTRVELRNSIAAVQQNLSGDRSVVVRDMRGPEPLAAFGATVRKALGLSEDAELHAKPALDMKHYSGVQPLFLTTQQQLGLDPCRGVPALVDALLPSESPMVVRKLLAALLSAPPPYTVADSTRQAVRTLMGLQEVVPLYRAGSSMTSAKVTTVLAAGEAPASFFRDLHDTLESVVLSLSPSRSPAVAAVVDASWPLLLHTMAADPGLLTQQGVLSAAQQALNDIRGIVADVAQSAEDTADKTDEVNVPAGLAALSEMSVGFELFRQRVTSAAIPVEWDAAVAAFHQLVEVAAEVQRLWQGLGLSLELVVDDATVAMCFRLKTKAALTKAALDKMPFRQFAGNVRYDGEITAAMLHPQPPQFLPAKQKNSQLRTCTLLENVQQKYRDAVATANEASLKALVALTHRLARLSTALAAAVHLGIVLSMLSDHAKAAHVAGWKVPYVGLAEQQQYLNSRTSSSAVESSSSSSDASRGQFHLKQLWPYWMMGNDTATVKNDVQLDGFMLLTGPNMAGKSTVLRSVAAAALCGCAGLAIPAAQGSMLPHLNAVVLRTFSGDAPAEGLSGFGVEMREMSYVLEEVQPGSLVLIDELGKGTEVITGTSLAGAMLEELVTAGTRGIFASHLHLLLKAPLNTPTLVNYRMEVEHVPGADAAPAHVRATNRLLPGSCTESLAFEVAREQNIPEDVLALAAQDYQALLYMGGETALVAAAAEGSSRWSVTSTIEGNSSDDYPKHVSLAAAGGRSSYSGLTSSSSNSLDVLEDSSRWSIASTAGSSVGSSFSDNDLEVCLQQQQQQQQQQSSGLASRRRPGRRLSTSRQKQLQQQQDG